MRSAHLVEQHRVLSLVFVTLPLLLLLHNASCQSTQSVVSSLIATSRFRSLVIVSTLDGQISALDAGRHGKGRLIWNVPSPSGPLFSSSLANVEFQDQAGSYQVVPALDGNLYTWRGGKLKAVPADIDSLFGQADINYDGSSLVGAKDKLSYGIDPDTGELHYVCSAQGCQLQSADESPDYPIARSDVLVIQRMQRTIRAYNKRRGFERWNVSIGEVDLSLEEGDEPNEDWGFCDGSDAVHDWNLRVSDGIVTAYSQSTNDLLWRHQFISPVANVWTLKGTCLLPWDLFQASASVATVHPTGATPSPSLYLGTHRNQMYIQTSASMSGAMHAWVRQATAAMGPDNYARKLLLEQLASSGKSSNLLAAAAAGSTSLQITHGSAAPSEDGVPQFLLSPDHRTDHPAIAATANNGMPPSSGSDKLSTELTIREPIRHGSYFYNTIPMQVCETATGDKLCFPTSVQRKPTPPPQAPYPFIVDTSWSPGLLSNMLLVLVSLLSGGFGYRFYLKRKTKDEVITLEIPELHASTSTKDSDSSPAKEDIVSDTSPATDRPPETFQSRFQSDFEKVKTLGKGGFGVVFQARNNFDSQQYAIKRVLLREGMHSKVMREVNALATLEHQNIVRYFNSWVERPPVGHIFDDDDIGVESGDGLDGDEDEDDEDEYDDECNDELGDAVSDLATRSTPADSSSMSNPMRHFPGRRPIPSYSSDNESSGGIVFGDLSAQNSTDNSRLAASPLLTNSSSYTDGIIARGTDGDDSSTSCTDTSTASGTVLDGEDDESDEDHYPLYPSQSANAAPSRTLQMTLRHNSSILGSDMDTPLVGGHAGILDSTSGGGFMFQRGCDSSSSGVGNGMTSDDSQSSASAAAFSTYSCDSSHGIKFSVSPRPSTENIRALPFGSNPAFGQPSHSDRHTSDRVATAAAAATAAANRSRSRRRRRKKSSMSEHSDSPRVYLYIQMQLCKEMDLKDWLHEHVSGRCPQQATKIFLQIVRAVGYVHDNKLMHRDLKPSNVFFAHDGRVKVGDFGLATESGHHRNLSRDDLHALACEFGSGDEGDEGEHTGQVGTEIYMSPELMKGQKYCHKVDIFSLGIIFFELLCPFETQMERMHVLLKARKHRFPQDFNEDQGCIIRELLAIDPGHRPTARDLYQRDLFKEILIQEAAAGGW
ncbi:eukaryotic translation initiation factor 2-alpha kinase 3-like isoform X1 [Sycon ciliatum]|uniref:eukaryotic translation initiation factor 2-alpha kinase 3-like isoform X1 n=1 Tax=Sycon ciliatum TaxID=27933 RepID=UPI0031F65CA5